MKRVSVKSHLEVDKAVPWIAMSRLVHRGSAILNDGLAIESGIHTSCICGIESYDETKIQPSATQVICATVEHLGAPLITTRDLE